MRECYQFFTPRPVALLTVGPRARKVQSARTLADEQDWLDSAHLCDVSVWEPAVFFPPAMLWQRVIISPKIGFSPTI